MADRKADRSCLVHYEADGSADGSAGGSAEPVALLVCVPPAGAGPALFRGWAARLPPGYGLVGVRLPGRESRFLERPLTTLAGMVDHVLTGLSARPLPVALYGHCFGAVLAFDLAAALIADGRTVLRLAVGSSVAPTMIPVAPRLSELPREEFRAFFGGLVPGMADGSMELMEPSMRADLAAQENRRGADDPLDCPVTAYHGRDDTTLSATDLRAWYACTRSWFTLRQLPAGHFLLDRAEAEAELLRTLAADLAADLTELDDPDVEGSRRP